MEKNLLPLADLEAKWGKGFLNVEAFTGRVATR